jgi:hypothetical protein
MAQVGEVPSNASEFATPSDPTTAWSHKWIPLPPGTDDDSSHPGDQKEHIVAESGSSPADRSSDERPPEKQPAA